MHLVTTPSVTGTGNWSWGSLEAGASDYVEVESNTRLQVLSTAPRGFIGLLFEFYQGSSFRGRAYLDYGETSSGNFSVGLNQSGLGFFRIHRTNEHTPSQNHLGQFFQVGWLSGASTGYEVRVYAVVI